MLRKTFALLTFLAISLANLQQACASGTVRCNVGLFNGCSGSGCPSGEGCSWETTVSPMTGETFHVCRCN
jgi:hypothetical protein